MTKLSKIVIGLLAGAIVLGGLIGFYHFKLPPFQFWNKQPVDFSECVKATRGFIMKSLPAQCEFRGQRFVDEPITPVKSEMVIGQPYVITGLPNKINSIIVELKEGPTPGILSKDLGQISVPANPISARYMTVLLREHIFNGDAGMAMQPGKYRLVVSVCDTEFCGGRGLAPFTQEPKQRNIVWQRDYGYINVVQKPQQ